MDSELHLTCRCKTDPCVCQQFCTPLKCEFRGNTSNVTLLKHIVQRKGEAEMALLDWLISAQDDIKQGEAVVSVVTSGDVDAVYTHMFMVSKYWPRNGNGSLRIKCSSFCRNQGLWLISTMWQRCLKYLNNHLLTGILEWNLQFLSAWLGMISYHLVMKNLKIPSWSISSEKSIGKTYLFSKMRR